MFVLLMPKDRLVDLFVMSNNHRLNLLKTKQSATNQKLFHTKLGQHFEARPKRVE